MSSLREYFEKMETEELQGILRSDYLGVVELPLDTILMICQILADRNPNKPDVKAAWRRFLKYYLEQENDL